MAITEPTIQDGRELPHLRGRPVSAPHSGLHFKTYLLILLVVIFSPLGNVLLSSGMKSVGPLVFRTPAQFFHAAIQIFSSPAILLGIASLLTYFVAYMLVLSWADYSYVQPATALGYVIVALLGRFALHEVVPPMRWLGIFIICLGVLIVGHTPPRTTEHR